MEPLTPSNIISLCSLALGIIGMLGGLVVSYRGNGVNQQRMADKLDSIDAKCADTRDQLREMNRKLDDHGGRLVKVEQQVITLFNRLDRLEKTHDQNHGHKIGGMG